MAMGFKYTDAKIINKMPRIGDVIVKDKGEIQDNFVIKKAYEHFYLAVAEKTKVRECFTKAVFALHEFNVIKKRKE